MNTTLIQAPQKLWSKLSNYCLKKYQGLTPDPRLFLMRKFARFEIVRDWGAMLLKSPTKPGEIRPE
jgi:hypothetical protein